MPPSRTYLKVEFDPATHHKVMAHTADLPPPATDIYRHLDRLCRLMPEVYRVERWRSELRGRHRQRFHEGLHEFVVIVKGSGTYTIDGAEVGVAADDVVVIKPGQVHSYSADSDFECISLHFSFAGLASLPDREPVAQGHSAPDEFLAFMAESYPRMHKVTLPDSSEVVSLAMKLMEELARPAVGSGLVAKACLVEMLVKVARGFLFAGRDGFGERRRTAHRDEIMVRRIKRHIDSAYAEDIDKDSFLSGFALHPNYIRNIFKKATGTSLSGYLVECRLLEARRMLSETAMPVRRIAEAAGFSDHSYFMRAFKKRYGCTPGALRKR